MRRPAAAFLALLVGLGPGLTAPASAASVPVVLARLGTLAVPSGPPPTDPVLADLALRPPAAVILDYDGTLTDRGPDGLSLPVPAALREGVVRLLEAGLPVALATGRNLDFQPDGPPMTVWEPLLKDIPAELRARVFFSGRTGGEFVLFDADGRPVRVQEGDWTGDEKAAVERGIEGALLKAGVERDAVLVVHIPGQGNVAFRAGDARVGPFSLGLAAELRANGLTYPVQRHRNWVTLGKYDKGDGMRLIYAALRARGHAVSEEGLLYVGDGFGASPGQPAGGDAAAALAFPRARAVSVGDAPGDVLPPNVVRLSVSGSEGTLRVIDAVLAGLAGRGPAPAPSAPERRRGVVLFAAGAAAGLALPLLWTQPAVAAALNAVALTFIAVPQIARNFRLKGLATRDLALGNSLIWLPVASLLSIVSVLNHSSLWFTASNLTAVAESLLLIGQINAYSPSPAARRRTLAALAATAVPAALGVWLLPAALAVKAAFAAAMLLLLFIDLPQIRKNYRLYRAEGRPPTGVSPLYPGLIWVGSLLGIVAGGAYRDWFWALNSVVSLVMISIVLGQLFLPRATNALLRPFFRRAGGEGPKPGTQAG